MLKLIYFGILGIIGLFISCNTASQENGSSKNIVKIILIKEINMDKYFTFFQKFFNEDNGKFGYYKVEGIQPEESFSRKKLNIDQFTKEKEVIIPPQYEDALEFSEGLAAVKSSGKWGVIDQNNNWAVEPLFLIIGEHYSNGEGLAFRDSLAPAKKDNLWGYINGEGNFIISPGFIEANCFSEGLAFVKIPGKNTWSIINKTGQFVKHTKFQVVQAFSEGMAAVLPSNSGWYFMNQQGGIIIDFNKKGFESAYSFSNGMALVRPQNKYFGFINTDGELIIDDLYVEALGFSYELAAVKEDNLWGFINKDGNWVIQPSYDFVNSFIRFPDGSVRAKVYQNKSRYFISNPLIK